MTIAEDSYDDSVWTLRGPSTLCALLCWGGLYINDIVFCTYLAFCKIAQLFQVCTQGQGLSALWGAALFGLSGLEENKRKNMV